MQAETYNVKELKKPQRKQKQTNKKNESVKCMV